MRFLAFGLALVISVPAAAFGGDTQQSKTEARSAKPKKICKLDEAGSTSRMRKSICRTVTELQETKESKTEVSDLQRHGSH